jgi:hypothetical protein
MKNISMLIHICFKFTVMQTDLRDILHLRKNLLKAVLNHLDWKVCFSLNCD